MNRERFGNQIVKMRKDGFDIVQNENSEWIVFAGDVDLFLRGVGPQYKRHPGRKQGRKKKAD